MGLGFPGILLDGYSALAVPIVDQIHRRRFAASIIFERGSDAKQRAAYLSAAKQALSHTVSARPLTV